MFRPVPMMRLSLVILARDERAVLRHLGRAGVMQLTRTPAGPETAPLGPSDRTHEAARCDRILARLENLRRSFELPPVSKETPELPEKSLDWAEEQLSWIETRSENLLQRRQSLIQSGDELADAGTLMSPYRGLQIPLDDPNQFSFLHFVTGRLPSGKLEKLETGDHVALLPLPAQNGWQPVVVMTTPRRWLTLESVLQQAGFQPENLPVVAGANLDAFSEKRQSDQAQMAAELEKVNLELQTLAAEFACPLAEIEQVTVTERRLLDAEQYFPRTETAILLAGWLPAADVAGLAQRLREITAGRCALKTVAPGISSPERVPVLLRHPWFLRPFQMLVSLYGLPEYGEVEPTVFVAVSFLLMFGMMFGDVGDGTVLAAIGLFMLLSKWGKRLRDAGLLLLLAGGASMIFGVVYGSYFGIPSLKKYALWHDPIEGDTARLLVISIEIGIVLISLGLVMNVINRFRRGDTIGGCLDKFGLAGVLFYWGMLALAVKYTVFQSHGWVTAAFLIFFALPILGWILKQPIEIVRRHRPGQAAPAGHGLVAALAESPVEVFEGLITYFSNTISFVRLAAYSMAHAALLMVTFMIAADLRHLPAGGGLLSILMIVFGNLVALVLEGFIASVQALRLEYYEFFGKFLSGTGQPFKPFRLAAP